MLNIPDRKGTKLRGRVDQELHAANTVNTRRSPF
jgi:hypothetical protein